MHCGARTNGYTSQKRFELRGEDCAPFICSTHACYAVTLLRPEGVTNSASYVTLDLALVLALRISNSRSNVR